MFSCWLRFWFLTHAVRQLHSPSMSAGIVPSFLLSHKYRQWQIYHHTFKTQNTHLWTQFSHSLLSLSSLPQVVAPFFLPCKSLCLSYSLSVHFLNWMLLFRHRLLTYSLVISHEFSFISNYFNLKVFRLKVQISVLHVCFFSDDLFDSFMYNDRVFYPSPIDHKLSLLCWCACYCRQHRFFCCRVLNRSGRWQVEPAPIMLCKSSLWLCMI